MHFQTGGGYDHPHDRDLERPRGRSGRLRLAGTGGRAIGHCATEGEEIDCAATGDLRS